MARRQPPPFGLALTRTLEHTALVLREALVYERMGAHRPHIALLLPGMARYCESREYASFLLSRRTHLLFLLQASDATFDACRHAIESAADGAASHSTSQGNVVLGRQWFSLRQDHASTPCGLHLSRPTSALDGDASAATQRAKYPRTQMQTIAVGRAYTWASALLPPVELFVRARLDAFHCVPPSWPAPPWQHDSAAVTAGRSTAGAGGIGAGDARPAIVFETSHISGGWHGLPTDRFAMVPSAGITYPFHETKSLLCALRLTHSPHSPLHLCKLCSRGSHRARTCHLPRHLCPPLSLSHCALCVLQVPTQVATQYFEAWRVWEGGVDCAHRCLAAGTIDGRERPGPAHGGALAGGECPLHLWLARHAATFEYGL